MFTIKAIIENRSGIANAPDTFTLFECHSLRVEPSRVAGANGAGQPPFVPPDWDVTLYDKDRNYVDMFHVGPMLDHYNTVYVMNEQGRTVQHIYPVNRATPQPSHGYPPAG